MGIMGEGIRVRKGSKGSKEKIYRSRKTKQKEKTHLVVFPIQRNLYMFSYTLQLNSYHGKNICYRSADLPFPISPISLPILFIIFQSKFY